MNDIEINRPRCDWVTATTYEIDVYRRAVRDLLPTVAASPTKQKRMQYNGHKSGHIFYGQGEQEGREHFMIQSSGEMADSDYGYILPEMTCKRVDLQVTCELPLWYKPRSLVDSFRQDVWHGRRRKVGLREDGSGGSTVYVGSRQSDKFIRVYVKGNHYLRFEIELKRSLAENAAKMMLMAPKTAVSGIIAAEIEKLPSHPIIEMFAKYTEGNMEISTYHANPDMVARMKWLSSLLPTIEKMAMDDTYGHTVTDWLSGIVESVKVRYE